MGELKDTDKVNNLYKELYNVEQVVENLLYFTNPTRGNHCSIGTIRRAYDNDTLGKLIKKMNENLFNNLINGKY